VAKCGCGNCEVQLFRHAGVSGRTTDLSSRTLTMRATARQVNGKLRGAAEVRKQAEQADAEAAARALPGVAKFLDGKPLRKTIYVPGKILNFIVGK